MTGILGQWVKFYFSFVLVYWICSTSSIPRFVGCNGSMIQVLLHCCFDALGLYRKFHITFNFYLAKWYKFHFSVGLLYLVNYRYKLFGVLRLWYQFHMGIWCIVFMVQVANDASSGV